MPELDAPDRDYSMPPPLPLPIEKKLGSNEKALEKAKPSSFPPFVKPVKDEDSSQAIPTIGSAGLSKKPGKTP